MSGVLESFFGKFLPSDKCLIQVRTTELGTSMLLHMLQHNIKKNQENLTQDFSQLFVHGSVFQPGSAKIFLCSEGLNICVTSMRTRILQNWSWSWSDESLFAKISWKNQDNYLSFRVPVI